MCPNSLSAVASSTSPKPVDLVLEGSKGQTTPTNDSPAHYQLDATPPDNDDDASDCSQSINWDEDEDDFDLPDDSPNTSRVAIPEVTQTTPTKPPQTTPIQSAKATPTIVEVSHDSSMEGLLTVDEEISNSESNFDDMDYEESLGTGHTHQPALGYPLTVSQLHASPGYTSILTVERVGGLVPEL